MEDLSLSVHMKRVLIKKESVLIKFHNNICNLELTKLGNVITVNVVYLENDV